MRICFHICKNKRTLQPLHKFSSSDTATLNFPVLADHSVPYDKVVIRYVYKEIVQNIYTASEILADSTRKF